MYDATTKVKWETTILNHNFTNVIKKISEKIRR